MLYSGLALEDPMLPCSDSLTYLLVFAPHGSNPGPELSYQYTCICDATLTSFQANADRQAPSTLCCPRTSTPSKEPHHTGIKLIEPLDIDSQNSSRSIETPPPLNSAS